MKKASKRPSKPVSEFDLYDWRNNLNMLVNEFKESGDTETHAREEFDIIHEDSEGDEEVFKEWFDDYALRLLSGAIMTLENVYSDEGIPIWRVITAPENWTPDARDLGIYWSWDKRAAQAHWGEFKQGHVKWRIESVAMPEQIDWRDTILLNADPFLSEESEIRLKAGAKVPIISLEKGDAPLPVEQYVGKKFAANPSNKKLKDETDYYMGEACSYLAIALHRKTGLPINILFDDTLKDDFGRGRERQIAHVFVIDKKGMAIDAKGRRPVKEVVDYYHDFPQPTVEEVTEKELRSYMGDNRPLYGYDKDEVKEAGEWFERNYRLNQNPPKSLVLKAEQILRRM